MTPPWCAAAARGVRLAIHVQPGAKVTEVVGLHGDALKLKLQAPPIDGRANDALVRFLAERLAVSRATVVITHGLASKRKLVEVAGVDAAAACAALLPGSPQ
jgi:uncharacterized protein (TIGR00251 family)